MPFALAAGDERRALRDGAVDLLGEAVGGGSRRERAEPGRRPTSGRRAATPVIAAVNFSRNGSYSVVDDDEALGRVAGLAAVVEAGGDGGLDGRVEVVGRQQDERIGAAQLEHDLLEVAAGDLGDGGAGALGAGQRDALHARVGDDASRSGRGSRRC